MRRVLEKLPSLSISAPGLSGRRSSAQERVIPMTTIAAGTDFRLYRATPFYPDV